MPSTVVQVTSLGVVQVGLRTIAQAFVEAIRATSDKQNLNGLMRHLYAALAEGHLNEDETGYLDGLIREKRFPRSQKYHAPRAAIEAVLASYKRPPHRRPRSMQDRARRRQWGSDGAMPAPLRACYTEGERAALSYVAREIQKTGACEFYIDKIAAAAGVSARTVQYALSKASKLRHLTIQYRRLPNDRKNRSNFIQIASDPWRQWLHRAKNAIGKMGCKMHAVGKSVHSNKTNILRKREEKLNRLSLRWSG